MKMSSADPSMWAKPKPKPKPKQKHSPLPWRVYDVGLNDIPGEDFRLLDGNSNHIMDESGIDEADARFIVLACNHFEEMREFIAIVESCSGWQKDSEGNYFEENGICPACVEDASKLLAKLEEADAD